MLGRVLVRAANRVLGDRPHRSLRTGVRFQLVQFLRRWPDHYRVEWTRRPSPPAPRLRQIHLEPTNACNLRCVTCSNPRQTAATGLMPLQRAHEVIDQALRDVGPDCIVGFYLRGESTLHPELPAMIRYAHERGFRRLLLSTNLTRLDAAQAEALLSSGLSELRLSIDGADAERFERIRAGADFAQVCDHLALLDATRRRLGVRVHFRLHATLDADGLRTVPRFLQRFGGVIDRFKLCVAVNQGGLFDAPAAAALSELRFAVASGWQRPCRILFEYAGVTWDGKVGSCCVDYHDRFVAGRLDDGIRQTFENRQSEALREDHRRGSLGPECAACGFSNALVDWFEDELNLYVEAHARTLQEPAGAARYQRWLTRTIDKFNQLADDRRAPAPASPRRLPQVGA